MKSFFDKLTGNSIDDSDGELLDIEKNLDEEFLSDEDKEAEEEEKEGELAIDVYDGGDVIIVKTMIAGVKPDDLDISITRDMLTIRGSRKEESEINENNYHQRELYWGSFSRSVMLPVEVDIDSSEAMEKHGLLILTLPKVKKNKKAKLKVK